MLNQILDTNYNSKSIEQTLLFKDTNEITVWLESINNWSVVW